MKSDKVKPEKCKYCKDDIPLGRYCICTKDECTTKLINELFEKHRMIYDRLGEI